MNKYTNLLLGVLVAFAIAAGLALTLVSWWSS